MMGILVSFRLNYSRTVLFPKMHYKNILAKVNFLCRSHRDFCALLLQWSSKHGIPFYVLSEAYSQRRFLGIYRIAIYIYQ